ncbi:MAG: FxsA family protein [Firmicutes bacterium]|nr:FxsA family protein [Bacillota bacterium]
MLLALILLPIAELAVLIELGRQVGTRPTIGLVLGTGVIGAALAKSQGLAVLRRMAAQLDEGRVPAEGLLDGLLILIGGLLLATPGLMTDAAGFFLLVPWSRNLIKRKARAKIYDWVRRGTVYISIR